MILGMYVVARESKFQVTQAAILFLWILSVLCFCGIFFCEIFETPVTYYNNISLPLNPSLTLSLSLSLSLSLFLIHPLSLSPYPPPPPPPSLSLSMLATFSTTETLLVDKDHWVYQPERAGGGILMNGSCHWLRPLRIW